MQIKKITAYLIIFLLIFGDFGVVLSNIIIEVSENYLISEDDVTAETVEVFDIQTVYEDIYFDQLTRYAEEESVAYASQLSEENISTTITLYGCDTGDCVVISYSYDSGVYRQLIQMSHLIFSHENEENVNYTQNDLIVEEKNVDSAGNTTTTTSYPTETKKKELRNLEGELAQENRELSNLNGQLSTIKNAFDNKKSIINSKLDNYNSAIGNMRKAAIDAKIAKQKLSDSKEENSRYKSEIVKLNDKIIKQEEELQILEEQFEIKLDTTDLSVNDLSTEFVNSVSEYTNSADSNGKDSVDIHNNSLSTINEISGMELGLQSIDIANIEEQLRNTTATLPDIGKIPETQFLTPDSHPNFNELRSAERYKNAAIKQINDENGPYKKEQLELVQLAELGIEAADIAFSENENEIGQKALKGALSVIDTALDFVPGVSAAKDAISLITGINPVTGEQVSDLERALLVGGFLLPSFLSGSAKVIKKSAKLLEKVFMAGKKSAGKADEFIDVIKSADDKLQILSKKPPC